MVADTSYNTTFLKMATTGHRYQMVFCLKGILSNKEKQILVPRGAWDRFLGSFYFGNGNLSTFHWLFFNFFVNVRPLSQRFFYNYHK